MWKNGAKSKRSPDWKIASGCAECAEDMQELGIHRSCAADQIELHAHDRRAHAGHDQQHATDD